MKKLLLVLLILPLFSFAQEESIPGCTNFYSSNYNSEATIDDGSCEITQTTLSEFTFTNCDQEGMYGPDQAQVNNEYAGTSLVNQVTSNNGIQEWVVPFSGTYNIDTYGAHGGYNGSYYGGLGAKMSGEFILSAGDILSIICGQTSDPSAEFGKGGGGGTFVWTSDTELLIAAGGGGGASNTTTNNSDIINGYITTSGGWHTTEVEDGFGGAIHNTSWAGGGGAGWYGNGQSVDDVAYNYTGFGGIRPLEGGFGGGADDDNYDGNAYGGFGGGGGSGVHLGGGGGGYTGGEGGGYIGGSYSTGGGGSYNAGENQDNIAGFNEGHGRVVITASGFSTGCTNEIAMNYNPSAVADDGSCLTLGCIFPMFPNYNAQATIDDGSCDMGSEITYGCTHDWAVNYNELATDNDGSCYREGCTLAWGDNYDELATLEDGSCSRLGCMDTIAYNYYIYATDEDGSCLYTTGCMDETAFNYNPEAVVEDGSCIAIVLGCMDISYFEYNAEANVEDGTCYTLGVLGCTDETAFNYYPDANIDDGSCIPVVLGCMDFNYVEYNEEANINEGCNTLAVYGCIDPSYTEYWDFIELPSGLYILNYPLIDGVNTDDGTCATAIIYGCTYEVFEEYNPEANVSGAGDCLTIIGYGCTDEIALNYNPEATSDDGSCVYPIYGCIDTSAFNYNSEANLDDGTCTWCQTLDIPYGWSMFSTYISPENMDLASVLSPITDNTILVKDNNGSPYVTEWAYNSIGEIVIGQGYQIKVDTAVSLEICGDYLLPENNSVSLSSGWNLVAYLRTEPALADAVFADIIEDIVLVKDYLGSVYMPEMNFNGIGEMHPGQGYQVKTSNSTVLTYLSNDETYRTSNIEVTNNAVSHFAKVAATDNNMTIVIKDAAWDLLPKEGAEIAAFDTEGILVGSTKYTSPLTVMTVWGDDATTEAKDGLVSAEDVTFVVWSKDLTRSIKIVEWTEGSSAYEANAINVAAAISTISTTNVIASERELVRVINVLGQEVNVNEKSFKGEILFNVYNDGVVEMKVY